MKEKQVDTPDIFEAEGLYQKLAQDFDRRIAAAAVNPQRYTLAKGETEKLQAEFAATAKEFAAGLAARQKNFLDTRAERVKKLNAEKDKLDNTAVALMQQLKDISADRAKLAKTELAINRKYSELGDMLQENRHTLRGMRALVLGTPLTGRVDASEVLNAYLRNL